jgi:hypothetical protein
LCIFQVANVWWRISRLLKQKNCIRSKSFPYSKPLHWRFSQILNIAWWKVGQPIQSDFKYLVNFCRKMRPEYYFVELIFFCVTYHNGKIKFN